MDIEEKLDYSTLIKNEFDIECVNCLCLSYEDQKEMYNILVYVQKKFRKTIFKELRFIKINELSDVKINGKLYQRAGTYKHSERSVILNSNFFCSNAPEENKKRARGQFLTILKHELGHYLFIINNMSKSMQSTYDKCKDFFDKYYNDDYFISLNGDRKLSELYARIFST